MNRQFYRHIFHQPLITTVNPVYINGLVQQYFPFSFHILNISAGGLLLNSESNIYKELSLSSSDNIRFTILIDNNYYRADIIRYNISKSHTTYALSFNNLLEPQVTSIVKYINSLQLQRNKI